MSLPPTIRWNGSRLILLDQRKLPSRVEYLELDDLPGVVDAIKTLAVRGAPAIGIAAAYGMTLAVRNVAPDHLEAALADAAKRLIDARPTAVNLAWAVRRVAGACAAANDPLQALEAEARAIHEEDRDLCRSIGEHGVALIAEGSSVLTHCNAGALAVSELGTATAPMYLAHRAGRRFRVYVDETRPVLQGARLTAWELNEEGIDVTLACDNAAAHLMAEGAIDLVIVGTDRVTGNGDVVNKIGTRGLAITCHYHGVPFYVACPSSSYDAATPNGRAVPIEERPAEEVTGLIDTAAGIRVRNPAFDFTPAELVTGWVTDRGLFTTAAELAAAMA